jgi:hypothetical protein
MGIGAISGSVQRHIPADGEIFEDYGEDWFADRLHVFSNIPLSRDYKDATEEVSTKQWYMDGYWSRHWYINWNRYGHRDGYRSQYRYW